MKNLAKANELTKKIASCFKCLTPITMNDRALFERFFIKERYTYGNSWSYVIQGKYGIGPHGLGYKYYDGKNLSSFVVYPKVDNPNQNFIFWTRPMGPSILKHISDISHKVLKDFDIPSYVKKIFENQLEYLKTQGFSDIKTAPWTKQCPSEDDSLPELIVDISSLFDNLQQHNVGKRLRKIDKIYQEFLYKNQPVFKDMNPTRHKEAWNATKEFFSFRKSLKDTYMISTEYDFYNMIYRPSLASNKVSKLLIISNKVAGFYYADIQNVQYAGLYGVILLRNKYPHITEFTMMAIFHELLNRGIRYVNLGGSEYKGVQDAKMKYHPQKTINMYWAVLR